MPNIKKWVNLSFLFCGLITWLFFREIFEAVFNALDFVRPEWLLAPSDLASIAVGAAVFIGLLKSTRAVTYLENVLLELSKVTWPNRKETVVSTGVVSVMVAIATICVLFFDTVWSWIAKAVLY